MIYDVSKKTSIVSLKTKFMLPWSETDSSQRLRHSPGILQSCYSSSFQYQGNRDKLLEYVSTLLRSEKTTYQ
jgi:hypothetical protein